MKTQHTWETCETCGGQRFDDNNRLCPDCGGDGCCLELLEIEQSVEGFERLVNDLAEDLFRRE